MCVVSNVGDHYAQKFQPWVAPTVHPSTGTVQIIPPFDYVTKAELAALKRDVEEMKELLKAAKKIDEALGEPDCEQEEKLAVLRAVAKFIGVDLDDVL